MKHSLSPKILKMIEKINSEYGENAISTLTSKIMDVLSERQSTGIESLDKVLGGGLPVSSIIELYGDPMSGKSTLALRIIAHIQQQGGTAAYLDAEHGFDSIWAQKFGVNLDMLLFNQPDNGEQAINIAIKLIRGNINIIVIDSVAALTPLEEIEEQNVENQKIALLARLMSKSTRLILSALQDRKSIILFINQFTTPISALRFFGAPLSTKGGLALKQMSRVRLEIVRSEYIISKEAEELGIKKGQIGQKVQIRVTKSKVSPPFLVADFGFMYYTKEELKKLGITDATQS